IVAQWLSPPIPTRRSSDLFRGDAFRLAARPGGRAEHHADGEGDPAVIPILPLLLLQSASVDRARVPDVPATVTAARVAPAARPRSEEHTSELQSRENLVCR